MKINIHIIVLIGVMLSLIGCDVQSVNDYDPSVPAEGDSTAKTTGTGTFNHLLMVENNATYMNVLEEDINTNIDDLPVSDVFQTNTFGKEGYRDELPYLVSNEINGLTINSNLPSFMYVPNHVGAFGTEAEQEWYVNSNWFVIDPDQVDYQYNASEVIKISGEIKSDQVWSSENQYLLVGQVFVDPGVTLTIEAGTTIFGAGRTGSTEPGVLIINRGAKIMAEGTPDQPIVFTSTEAIGSRDRGDWGGLVILGKSPNNKGEDVTIEGIDSTGDNGKYGGNEPNDNSGVLRFIRIEYAGIALSPGNEINTLTLGSVGQETQIDHIITSYAGDDAYEWFGGNVNLKYLVAYNTLDDDFDTDAGYTGNVQYAYVLRNEFASDISGSKCFESTSSKNAGATPTTSCVFSNVTVVGPLYLTDGGNYDPQFQNGIKASNYSAIQITNSVIVGCPIGAQNY